MQRNPFLLLYSLFSFNSFTWAKLFRCFGLWAKCLDIPLPTGQRGPIT